MQVATTITNAYSSVTVLSDSLAPTPPSPLNQTQIKDLFDLDTTEEKFEEKIEDQSNRKDEVEKLDTFDKQDTKNDIKIEAQQEDNIDLEVTEEVAGNLEQDLMTENTIVETAPNETVKIVEDIKTEKSASRNFRTKSGRCYYR